LKKDLEKAKAKVAELEAELAKRHEIGEQLKELLQLLGTDDPDVIQKALQALAQYAEGLAGENPDDMSVAEIIAAIAEQAQDMEGQLVNMKEKMQAQGLGLPPCWPDPNDPTQPDFTFDVFLYENGTLKAKNISPPYRQDEYAKLPGTEVITSGRIPLARFASAAAEIKKLGEQNGCAYYAKIDFENADACRYQVDVEEYFYKHIPPSRKAKCSGLR
jgi:hypothetical protein